MRLDGFGLFVEDMGKMIRFYRDVLGFEIKEAEDSGNVYLRKKMDLGDGVNGPFLEKDLA